MHGAAIFLVVTVGLTWLGASVLLPWEREPDGALALLQASVTYVVVLGFPPLFAAVFARRRTPGIRFDDGLRTIAFRESLFAVSIAGFVLAIAMALEEVVSGAFATQLNELEVGFADIVRHVMAYVLVVAMLWFQAIIEEFAWRSYLLPRLMHRFGAWAGLWLHGTMWGLCHAPIFGASGSSIARSLGFVVTLSLFGVILGWLRLCTKSIYGSAAANATLTISAGLPLFLLGNTSRFSAAFEPPGWVPLLLVVNALIWYRPWRDAVTIPEVQIR